MSTIVLRRHLIQRSFYACGKCGAGSPRWHSSAKNGGFEALRKKLPALADKQQPALPDKPARTRFAPSPTGYLHLGSLRTALFNWLIARATGGQFIIRVEDTDRTRIVDDSVPRLLADLKWAELNWDEGPDVGGAFGPYVQSQRLDLYRSHVKHLLEEGKAYRCFCTPQDLERLKEKSLDANGSAHYPGTCRHIPPDQAERRAASGETHIVRFRSESRPSFVDKVYGRFQKNEDEDDFILIKSDGYPTYHFANVVDDHLMEITHVIRGAEWLISTPKHIALYDAFKWQPPTFAHAGLLCAPNGEKLSKRNHDIDISSYRDKGILPSALNNWLALLGWSVKGAGVFETPDELAKNFSLKFTKGNIKTNPDKLANLQRKHLTYHLSEKNFNPDVLKSAIVPPALSLINNVSVLLAANKEQVITSPTNPKSTFSTTDFSTPVPVLADPSKAPAHLLRIFRTLAADSPIDPQELIYEHPSLYFRPSAAAYARHTFTRSQTHLSSLPSTELGLAELLRDLGGALAQLSEREWTPDRVQAVIIDFIDRNANVVADDKGKERQRHISKAAYMLLRLVLTGDPDRGAKPAKLQIALLGREETLRRFEMCSA